MTEAFSNQVPTTPEEWGTLASFLASQLDEARTNLIDAQERQQRIEERHQQQQQAMAQAQEAAAAWRDRMMNCSAEDFLAEPTIRSAILAQAANPHAAEVMGAVGQLNAIENNARMNIRNEIRKLQATVGSLEGRLAMAQRGSRQTQKALNIGVWTE